MFIVSYDVDSGKNILEIQTSDLELGDYILYVVSFESDSVTPLYFGSLSVSVQLPDLNVSSITVSPSNPIAGQSVTITATVKNLGDVDAGPFNVSTFANGVLINKNRVNGLSASSETTISFQWTPASAGSYSIRVVADSENEVSEINEANNEKSTTISVSSKPTRRFLPGGGGGGGAIPGVPIYVNPYVSIRAGEEYEIKMPSVTVNDTNVVSIILIPEKNVITKVRVEKISELPEDLPALNNVILALKIDLTLSTETKVRGYVKFVLKRDEIRAKGFDPDNVVATMLKFDGQQWVRLKTEFTGKDDKYNYYKAEVPSFSYFAVILEAPKPTPTTPTTTIPTTVTTVATTTPAVTPAPPPVSIEVVAGIVVLVLLIAIVAYALRRRR
jgi:PGF-pre-PGF domain-containing protein